MIVETSHPVRALPQLPEHDVSGQKLSSDRPRSWRTLSGCMAVLAAAGGLHLGCSPSATGQPPQTPSAPQPQPRPEVPELPTPEWLPPEAREMLTSRMHRHGEEMMLLVVSVVILSYEGTEQLAREIAREPKIGRPRAGEQDTINALLPPRFFDLQDELRERAEALADAAHARDPGQVVKTYGRLAETCVTCHAVYMEPPPEYGEPDAFEDDT